MGLSPLFIQLAEFTNGLSGEGLGSCGFVFAVAVAVPFVPKKFELLEYEVDNVSI